MNQISHTDDRNIRRWAGRSIRPLTTSFPSIDTADLHSEQLLDPGAVGLIAWETDGESGWCTVNTVCRDEILELKIEISEVGVSHIDLLLELDPCRFGGHRKWLICPCCGERARVLYISDTWLRLDWIACRGCAGLAYPSNRMRRFQRLERRAERISELLDWNKNDEPCRPKGMHHRTFHRLVEEYVELTDAAGEAFQEEAASWTGLESRLLKNARRILSSFIES